MCNPVGSPLPLSLLFPIIRLEFLSKNVSTYPLKISMAITGEISPDTPSETAKRIRFRFHLAIVLEIS